MTTFFSFRIRSRRDAAEFVRRAREFVPGGVMQIRTPRGNVLTVKAGDGEYLWTRCVITPSGFYTREEVIQDPAGWVYANRRAINRWLRHLEEGGTPNAVAE